MTLLKVPFTVGVPERVVLVPCAEVFKERPVGNPETFHVKVPVAVVDAVNVVVAYAVPTVPAVSEVLVGVIVMDELTTCVNIEEVLLLNEALPL